MKAVKLHSISRARKLIKPSLLITVAILAITTGTTAQASHRHNSYNGISSISLGFTYSPGGHGYYQPYSQRPHYRPYRHGYRTSYRHYRPARRGHGYKYRRYNEHDD